MVSSVKQREGGGDDDDDDGGGVMSDGHEAATAGQPAEVECYYGCDSTLRSAGVPRLALSDYFSDETPESRSPVPSSSPRADDGSGSSALWSTIVDDGAVNNANDNAVPPGLLTRGASRRISADYYDLSNSGKPRTGPGPDANLADFSLDLLQQSGKYVPPGVRRQQSLAAGYASRHGQRQASFSGEAAAPEVDDADVHHTPAPAPADAVMYQGLADEEVFHGHCTEEGRGVLLAMLSRPEVGRRLTSSQWAQCLTRWVL